MLHGEFQARLGYEPLSRSVINDEDKVNESRAQCVLTLGPSRSNLSLPFLPLAGCGVPVILSLPWSSGDPASAGIAVRRHFGLLPLFRVGG